MKRVICVLCPRGCEITVVLGKELGISGNGCPKGEEYVLQELEAPQRTLTTTVKTVFPDFPRLPVRTVRDVPLKEFPRLMKILCGITITERIKIGDTVVKDSEAAGFHIIATADLEAPEPAAKPERRVKDE